MNDDNYNNNNEAAGKVISHCENAVKIVNAALKPEQNVMNFPSVGPLQSVVSKFQQLPFLFKAGNLFLA